MHANAYNFVKRVVATQRLPVGPVVEIGGRDINGSVRELFEGRDYTSIDLYDGPGVDVVANGATYRPKKRPAVVVCCEVLEHAANAAQLCLNAWAMLSKGGAFIVTAATTGRVEHSAIDGGSLRAGEYYENVTWDMLRLWCRRFVRVDYEFNEQTCDIYALARKGLR